MTVSLDEPLGGGDVVFVGVDDHTLVTRDRGASVRASEVFASGDFQRGCLLGSQQEATDDERGGRAVGGGGDD